MAPFTEERLRKAFCKYACTRTLKAISARFILTCGVWMFSYETHLSGKTYDQ